MTGGLLMTLESAILRNIEKLPDSVKQAVFLYTEFLASQYANHGAETTGTSPRKQPLAGWVHLN